MVASSSTDYQGPMPMDIGRVQGAKGKGKKGKNDNQKGKGKDVKGKGKKGKEGDHKGKGKGKDQKGKGVATICYCCGKPGHLAKDCWRNKIRQVAGDQAHSSSGSPSSTIHTVGQQHASVTDTKPAVRRIENSESRIFDLRERNVELEDQRNDEPEFQEVEEVEISDDEPMVRRLGEENADVAIY